jgi:hypothetical protein
MNHIHAIEGYLRVRFSSYYEETDVGLLSTQSPEANRLFERPDFPFVALYTLLCAPIHPYLYVLTLINIWRSLFPGQLFVRLGSAVSALVMGSDTAIVMCYLECRCKCDCTHEQAPPASTAHVID